MLVFCRIWTAEIDNNV